MAASVGGVGRRADVAGVVSKDVRVRVEVGVADPSGCPPLGRRADIVIRERGGSVGKGVFGIEAGQSDSVHWVFRYQGAVLAVLERHLLQQLDLVPVPALQDEVHGGHLCVCVLLWGLGVLGAFMGSVGYGVMVRIRMGHVSRREREKSFKRIYSYGRHTHAFTLDHSLKENIL